MFSIRSFRRHPGDGPSWSRSRLGDRRRNDPSPPGRRAGAHRFRAHAHQQRCACRCGQSERVHTSAPSSEREPHRGGRSADDARCRGQPHRCTRVVCQRCDAQQANQRTTLSKEMNERWSAQKCTDMYTVHVVLTPRTTFAGDREHLTSSTCMHQSQIFIYFPNAQNNNFC